jgi:hypothetical protein
MYPSGAATLSGAGFILLDLYPLSDSRQRGGDRPAAYTSTTAVLKTAALIDLYRAGVGQSRKHAAKYSHAVVTDYY